MYICRHWTGWAYSHFLLTNKTKDSRPSWLELPNTGNTPLSFYCRKGIIFKVFFCTLISSFLLKKSPLLQLIFIWDGFLTDYLKWCNLSLQGTSFWNPSHLIPLVASLLEAFSWPFTLLSNWLCIQHKFLPNCLSQHELLSYSVSLCSPSFCPMKEHATVNSTGKNIFSCF